MIFPNLIWGFFPPKKCVKYLHWSYLLDFFSYDLSTIERNESPSFRLFRQYWKYRCYMMRMKDQDNMHGWGGKDRVIHLICLKSCCIMQNIILNDFARRTQLVWRKYPNFLFKYKHRYNYSKRIQGVLSEYCLKRLFSSDISS